MFVRKKKNKSGSLSIQIKDKFSGKYKVVETVGSSHQTEEISKLVKQAYRRISEIFNQEELELITENDRIIQEFLKNDKTIKVRVTGQEEIFEKIFDSIGFNKIEDKLFSYFVITRLVHPVSKLKTIGYDIFFQRNAFGRGK